MEDDVVSDARAALDDISRLRRRTRQQRQAFWFPTLVFAVVTLASAWFYPSDRFGGSSNAGDALALGGQTAADPESAALYWLIAIPAGYLLAATYYVWRARRRGVVSPWRIWALTGFAFLALTVFLLQEFWGFLPGDLTIRGLLALVVIAVGLGVLAATQRSLEFGIFAALFLALAIAANLYDMANLTQRLAIPTDDAPYVNNLAAGAMLLLASAWFALRARGWSVRVSVRIAR